MHRKRLATVLLFGLWLLALLPSTATAAPIVNKTVYGYYPHWVTGYDQLEWELLTHVAWFGISLNSDGTAAQTNGWPGSWTGLVDAAHANEVRLDVAFTLFSSSGIDTLVNSADNRDEAITTIIGALEAGQADGVAIDFEGVPSSAAAGFADFLGELRFALDGAGHADAQISVAGPAVDWSGAFDLGLILPDIDVFFIMGYDYFYGGSDNAGPTGILVTDDFWRDFSYGSQLRSMAYYASMTDEAGRGKIVMGVPYYGREWTTVDGSLGASVTGEVGSVTYATAMADLEAPGITREWDDGAMTPWYAFEDLGTWHQVYFDDEESLAWKYRFLSEQGLGGVGMWALRYDAGYSALWDEIDFAFAADFEPREGDRLAPVEVLDFPFEDARDTSDMATGGCFFNYYSCDPSIPEWGREVVYRVEVCHEGALVVHVEGDGATVDNDVHILTAPAEDACVARGHTDASWDVAPGTYWVAVDTWVDDGVPRWGPYELTIDGDGIPFPQCAYGLVCQGGECVDPTAPADGGPDGGDTDADADTDGDADGGGTCFELRGEGEGCGCRAAGATASGAFILRALASMVETAGS